MAFMVVIVAVVFGFGAVSISLVFLICFIVHAANRAFARFVAAAAFAVHGADVGRGVFRALFGLFGLGVGVGLTAFGRVVAVAAAGRDESGECEAEQEKLEIFHRLYDLRC